MIVVKSPREDEALKFYITLGDETVFKGRENRKLKRISEERAEDFFQTAKKSGLFFAERIYVSTLCRLFYIVARGVSHHCGMFGFGGKFLSQRPALTRTSFMKNLSVRKATCSDVEKLAGALKRRY